MAIRLTHEAQLLRHLREHNSITPMEALEEFGCYRLAARIYDLRVAGHPIHTVMITHDGSRYARYILTTK